MVIISEKQKNIKQSLCLFCSLGCGTSFRSQGDEITAIDYDRENPINLGSLCPRGHYNFELLNHPRRLVYPQIGARKTSWDDALDFARQQLKEFEADSIGIILSSNASNEDACLAAKLAKSLGTKNICAAGNPFDQEAYQGEKWETPGAELSTLDEIGKAETLLIIGDILRRSPVLSWRINQVKYGKRGNRIIVADPNKTHTSWFATSHLRHQPGTAALLLLAMVELIGRETGQGELGVDIDAVAVKIGLPVDLLVVAARDFHASPSGTIIVTPSPAEKRNDLIVYFAKLLASLSPGKKYIPFYGYGNTRGVNLVLDRCLEEHISYPGMIDKIAAEQIKALIMLGEDLAGTHPEIEKKFKHMRFVAASNYFVNDLVDDSIVIFPLASQMEEGGTYVMADGRLENRLPIAPKVGGRSNGEIAAGLMGQEFNLNKTLEETGVIIRQGIPAAKTGIEEKIAEAQQIAAGEKFPPAEITHFGNNRMTRNFFWFRVNPHTLNMPCGQGVGVNNKVEG